MRRLEALLRQLEDERRDQTAKVDRLSVAVKDAEESAMRLQASLTDELRQHAHTRRLLEDAQQLAGVKVGANASMSPARHGLETSTSHLSPRRRGDATVSVSSPRSGRSAQSQMPVTKEVLTVKERGSGGINGLHTDDVVGELRRLASRLQDELDRFHTANFTGNYTDCLFSLQFILFFA